MPDHGPSRKALFKAAAALAEESVGAWATRHGVSYQHLFEVLNGQRVSPRLTTAVDEYVATQFAAIPPRRRGKKAA